MRFQVQQFAYGWFNNGSLHGRDISDAYNSALRCFLHHKHPHWQGPLMLRLTPEA